MKYLLLMSVAALSVGLTGCGSSASADGENNAPLCLDMANPFEYPISTFVVEENLERSSSWDYLQGIQYVSGGTKPDDIPGMIKLMENNINKFAIYTGIAAIGIESLNNAIDTMEEVVAAEDTAGNIYSAKVQMEGAIQNGATCSYNNRAAVLRDASNVDPADPEDNLLRYILDYNYTSGTNRLARTIAHYKEVTKTDPVTEKETTTNEILATSLSALNPDTFVTVGYNAPLATTTQWSDSGASLTITKDYQERTDRAAYISTTAFTVGDNDKVKRFKISIDYDNNYEAKIYISEFVSAVTCYPNDPAKKEVLYDPTVEELKAKGCEKLKDEDDVIIREAYKDVGYDVTDIDPKVPGSGTDPTPLDTYTATPVEGR